MENHKITRSESECVVNIKIIATLGDDVVLVHQGTYQMCVLVIVQ